MRKRRSATATIDDAPAHDARYDVAIREPIFSSTLPHRSRRYNHRKSDKEAFDAWRLRTPGSMLGIAFCAAR